MRLQTGLILDMVHLGQEPRQPKERRVDFVPKSSRLSVQGQIGVEEVDRDRLIWSPAVLTSRADLVIPGSVGLNRR